MNIRAVEQKDRSTFNTLALHPLQSWEWGEFRQKTGIEVIRLGAYSGETLKETAQITIHQIPFTSFTIGYLPKGRIPSMEMIKALMNIGKKYKCIFIKLEPNVTQDEGTKDTVLQSVFKQSPHPLFTKYTFQLDITPTEEDLLKNMHPKTRYNIRVAEKHNVTVEESTSSASFDHYLRLMQETTTRQKYFAHTEHYHRLMWNTLKTSGIAHLLEARYEGNVIVSWIVFLFNGIMYYPYGASSSLHRNVMASNLMMWKAIQFGKTHKAKLFDMWGALGPNPNSEDPWYGFHRFKQGFGAKHVAFLGSFDLVIYPHVYTLYNSIYRIREVFLQLKSHFFTQRA